MWNDSLIVAPVETSSPGYHVNIPADLMAPELEAFQIFPVTPTLLIMGIETAFLRFANFEEAQQAMPQWWIED